MNKFDKIYEGIFYCKTLHCDKCPYYNEDDALCKKKLLNDTLNLLDRVAHVINYSRDENLHI